MILASHGIIGSISGVDADWLAFYNRVIDAGGSLTTTEQNATKQLVASLKANSLWTPMKAIYPMVGASAAACKQNLKSSSFTGTFNVPGWTFSSAGAKPDPTKLAYMDTGFHWRNNTDLNNAAFGAYWTDYTATTSSKSYGGYDASGIAMINQKTPTGDHYINSLTGINANMANGFHAINRISSTSIDFIVNNSISSGLSTSTTKYNGNMWLGGTNGLVFGYVGWNYAFSFFSEGFTSSQWSTLYSIVQAFQTTLGRQV